MGELISTSDLPERKRSAVSPAPPVAVAPAQAPSVVIVQGSHGPGFLVRAVWYVFVGWWLTGLALAVGYLAGLTIVGLPAAFMIFNKTGTLLTLRPRSQSVNVEHVGGITLVSHKGADQAPLWLRATYFVLIGWWVAALWMAVAYMLNLTVIGIPLGIMMLNRLPAVYTLQRN